MLRDEDDFLALNDIKLLSFEHLNNGRNVDQLSVQSVILTRKDYQIQNQKDFNVKDANAYNIVFSTNKSNTEKNSLKKEIIKKEIRKNNIFQVVKLDWYIKGKNHTTEAIFSGDNLIYDDILSNYRIINQKSVLAKKPTPDSKSSYDCQAQQNDHPSEIGLTKEIWTVQNDVWLGQIGEGHAAIEFRGIQNPQNCEKQLGNYNTTRNG